MNAPKSDYDTFKEVSRITLTDDKGNEVKIVLSANLKRFFKVEYYIEDILLKPVRFNGKHKALKFWEELTSKLHFQPKST